MKNVTIIGAGLSGIIAANILHRHNPKVIEKQSTLPDNHSAVLRFRTDAVSRATGIKFEKVLVRKGIWDGATMHNECNIRLANAYSQNVLGATNLKDRSIWDLEAKERFIAPPDFISRAAESLNINLGMEIVSPDKADPGQLVISTIPMPIMVKMFGPSLGFDGGEMFKAPALPVHTIRATVKGCSVHQTIYNGQLNKYEWYRASIHSESLIVESSRKIESPWRVIESVSQAFGVVLPAGELNVSEQKAGKMMPIDETERQRFISSLSDEFGIFSLGRLATHRPKLLLDDIPGDIESIFRIKDSRYQKTKQESKKP